jgi:hypothetical protein
LGKQDPYCGGRYRVRTIQSEMKMSHWIDAPVVERVSDEAVVLDLSDDVWDLCRVDEEGEVLVLVMRKYPGLTQGVEVRILPEGDRYTIAGTTVTCDELLATLRSLP